MTKDEKLIEVFAKRAFFLFYTYTDNFECCPASCLYFFDGINVMFEFTADKNVEGKEILYVRLSMVDLSTKEMDIQEHSFLSDDVKHKITTVVTIMAGFFRDHLAKYRAAEATKEKTKETKIH